MDGQTGSETKRGIFKAMHAVMSEVGVIGKDRKNPQQGYQFRGIDDVLAVLQPLFIKHGIVCLPKVLKTERELLDTKSGGKMASVRLLVEHTFFCAADGSSVYATTFGEAMDAGDKASNKAMSAALKYALTESFSIPTKESDRDTEEQSPELAPKTSPVAQPRTESGRASTFRAPGQQTIDAPRPAPKPSTGGATFPGYGSMSGKALSEGSDKDLAWYAGNCRKSIADPAKAKWIDKERATLAAIEAEQARRGGSQSSDEPPPHTDEDRQF